MQTPIQKLNRALARQAIRPHELMDQIITAALDLKYQRVDDILPILHLVWDYSESFAEILQDLER